MNEGEEASVTPAQTSETQSNEWAWIPNEQWWVSPGITEIGEAVASLRKAATTVVLDRPDVRNLARVVERTAALRPTPSLDDDLAVLTDAVRRVPANLRGEREDVLLRVRSLRQALLNAKLNGCPVNLDEVW